MSLNFRTFQIFFFTIPKGEVIGKVEELSFIWIPTGKSSNRKDTEQHEEDFREELGKKYMPPILRFSVASPDSIQKNDCLTVHMASVYVSYILP